MKNLETINNETKLLAYQLLDKPLLPRSVFLEGAIHLEMIMDNLIITYFFGFLSQEKIEMSDKAKDFSKCILNDFGYRKKVKILKSCKIIDYKQEKKLVAIGEKRNIAAHSIALQLSSNNSGLIKGKNQKELINVNNNFIEEYKKDFSECYAYLMVKLLSLYNPKK